MPRISVIYLISASIGGSSSSNSNARKKKKMADKVLHPRVRELVPESQAYMDLLAFERKLDATIMRKRLDIQEALKRPMKVSCFKFFMNLFAGFVNKD